MRIKFALLAGALLIAGGAAHAASEQADKSAAAAPVDCLRLNDIRSTRIIDRTAILYETRGGKLYVNRPRSGQQWLNKWDVLVTDTHSSHLCSIDIVRLYDPISRMQTGFVGLGQFVPYARPRAQD